LIFFLKKLLPFFLLTKNSLIFKIKHKSNLKISFSINLIILKIISKSKNVSNSMKYFYYFIPLIIILNLFTGRIEEKYDMMVRFKKEYTIYKKTTKALGPWRYWLKIVLSTIIPIVLLMI